VENSVPKLSLKKMSVDQLIALRDQIQSVLATKIAKEQADLQKQIDALAKLGGIPGRANGRAMNGQTRRRRSVKAAKSHAAKGKKVAPKFRGPGGETWSGRGLAPRWLAELEAKGKKRESFLIKS
jgi:DNA-binding protein H-NS